ncbi:hypothetical protein D3C86_1643390 [compost metagenome]
MDEIFNMIVTGRGFEQMIALSSGSFSLVKRNVRLLKQFLNGFFILTFGNSDTYMHLYQMFIDAEWITKKLT